MVYLFLYDVDADQTGMPQPADRTEVADNPAVPSHALAAAMAGTEVAKVRSREGWGRAAEGGPDPQAEAQARLRRRQAAMATSVPPRHPGILVVDDDAAIREALDAALADRYTVYTAASGAEACDTLRSRPVAAIILDAILGEEDGLDQVERFHELSHAPIVILTGHSTEGLAIRALRSHVAEYLKKPISVPNLFAVLGRLVPETQRVADLVARLRGYLDAYPPTAFRPTELATRLGVSETHVRRLFRAAQGQTPRQYLTEVRIRRAACLLRDREKRVKEVALEVGFVDARHFRRTFTRLMGMTPAVWRGRPAQAGGTASASKNA